jgi:hypothetical protein
MGEKAVAAKLGLKPGHATLLIAAPADGASLLGSLPEGAALHEAGAGPFDAVVVFIPTSATLTAHSERAITALKPGGLLWPAYPKQTGAVASDMSRERAWEAFAALDWRPVSQIAIDDTWSALRFRPVADVKSSHRHVIDERARDARKTSPSPNPSSRRKSGAKPGATRWQRNGSRLSPGRRS